MKTIISSTSFLKHNYIIKASFLTSNSILIIIPLALLILGGLIYYSTKLKQNKNNLKLQTNRYESLFKLTSDVLWEYDINKDILKKSSSSLGISYGTKTIHHFRSVTLEKQLIHPLDIIKFKQFYDDLHSGKEHIFCELRAKVVNDNYEWLQLTGTSINNDYNIPVLVVGQTLNIHNKKTELELLKSATLNDPLTRVFKRHAILDKIETCIVNNNQFMLHAILIIDIKHFKSINATYGYTYGNAVLLEISSKLIKYFNNGTNLIGRFNGDEFILFLYNLPNISSVESEATKIINIFNHINTGDEAHTPVHGSIGIAIYPSHGSERIELVDKAYTALIEAKKKDGSNYCIYSDQLSSQITHINSPTEKTTRSHYALKDNSTMDTNLLSNVVDILFDARKLDISINIILSLLGDYYNLSSIIIFEFKDNNSSYLVNYIWSNNNLVTEYNVYESFTYEDIKGLRQYYRSPDSTFYNDSINDMDLSTKHKEKLQALNVSGCLQCGIYEGGADKGFIAYHYNNKLRSWEGHELNTLISISKILGGYLIKLRTEQKVNEITHLDSLTGCYNLSAFTEQCHKMICKNPKKNYIIMYSDIDKFKLINETFGYSEGDRILIAISNILKENLKEDELYGRVNADKFVLLLNYDNKTAFGNRISELLKEIEHIKKTDNDYFRFAFISGICPVNRNINISLNIDRANIARKSIVNRHKSNYTFFNEDMKSRLVKQREIEDIMEDALRKEEFLVYYQPKVNLSDEKLCGAEALIRWERDGKLIPPDDFIPIFEEDHFITRVDYYVLEKVCMHMRSLLDQGKQPVPVSVNFSRIHLTKRILVQNLNHIVAKYKVPKDLIEIELTESALVSSDSYLLGMLNQIHESGFRLTMDDFGSGMSSLNLLRQLPFDVLKLDKDFFQKGTSTKRELVVITNIVKMAKELEMTIVSEGVETKEQADFLRKIDCTIAQGYLYGKPIPIKEFEDKYYN